MTQKRKNSKLQNRHLRTVRCECGREILVLPDLRAMANAVEAHIMEHLKGEKDPVSAARESDRLWNWLVAEVFQVASAAPEVAQ
jgi:hypothetical protein